MQYDYLPVNLRAEQHPTPEYRAVNPRDLVPALVHEGIVLTQSPAIIEWLEAHLASDTERGAFCYGNSATLADVYLIPQVESARRFRFNVNVARWPSIRAVDAACGQLDGFRLAAPAVQPDAAGDSAERQLLSGSMVDAAALPHLAPRYTDCRGGTD